MRRVMPSNAEQSEREGHDEQNSLSELVWAAWHFRRSALV